MKSIRIFPSILVGIVATLAQPSLVHAADNFQIAPPPIAYPYFEPGKSDIKVEPMVVNISSPSVSLSGGGMNFDARHVFTSSMAADFQGGFFALNGEMPAVPPITLIPAKSASGSFLGYYTTQTTGKAQVMLTSLQVSANLEFQPIHGDSGGMIIFGGPALGVVNMNMRTPYNLVWGATQYTGYHDTLTINSAMIGFQIGLQGDMSLSHGLRISPFIMTGSSSGSSTLADDPGTSGGAGYTTTADIPAFTTTSLGMDIIIGNFSVGTMLQQMKPSQSNADSVNITLLRMGFRF